MKCIIFVSGFLNVFRIGRTLNVPAIILHCIILNFNARIFGTDVIHCNRKDTVSYNGDKEKIRMEVQNRYTIWVG